MGELGNLGGAVAHRPQCVVGGADTEFHVLLLAAARDAAETPSPVAVTLLAARCRRVERRCVGRISPLHARKSRSETAHTVPGSSRMEVATCENMVTPQIGMLACQTNVTHSDSRHKY
ncbi:hypothetical protein RHRU231_830042 [Rhodococcus ruber]|uniref:Uncharacterized protein n=1 Tax=Rhodococcus ruber TaxID=1830 RepID=A0A098BRU0_9NOCA|nr:hypothetical protein RHRU231_830042 [Rhodococcus ruber]